MESYCVRCKKKTPNLDEHTETTKNNRKALKSICVQYVNLKKVNLLSLILKVEQ